MEAGADTCPRCQARLTKVASFCEGCTRVLPERFPTREELAEARRRERELRSDRSRRRARRVKACAVAAVLLAIVAAGAGLRAQQAADPHDGFSTDERLHAEIALSLAEHATYGEPHFLSPPAAPALFALAYKLHPKTVPVGKLKRPDIPAAYWAQAVIGTALILVVFALAQALAGGLAGLLAAAATAFYSPLITYTGELLNEPLAALLLALSALAMARAWGRWPPWQFALAGVLLGLAALTRSELLLLAPAGAAFVGLASLRWLGPRRSALAAAAVAGGATVIVAPWILQASSQAGSFVPVTRSSATFYIGTHMPTEGTSGGLKKSFGLEARERIDARYGKFTDATMKQAIAARYPQLGDQASLARQARENLWRYAVGDPIRYGAVMVDKTRRLLFSRSALSFRDPASDEREALIHRLLIGFALLGLAWGSWRSHDPRLVWLALVVGGFTLFHAALTEPYARYMLKVVPLAFAGGAAGARLALGVLRRRAPRGGLRPGKTGPRSRMAPPRDGGSPLGTPTIACATQRLTTSASVTRRRALPGRSGRRSSAGQ